MNYLKARCMFASRNYYILTNELHTAQNRTNNPIIFKTEKEVYRIIIFHLFFAPSSKLNPPFSVVNRVILKNLLTYFSTGHNFLDQWSPPEICQ
jgi:hypothetical protein